jgi:TolB-like protein
MATGRAPFLGSSLGEMIAHILHSEPEAMGHFNPEVPAELERITRKCLEKKPQERYQTAKELRVELQGLKRDTESGRVGAGLVPTPEAGAVVPTQAGRPQGVPLRKRLFGAIAGATIILVAAVLLARNVGGLRDRLLGPVGPPRIESLAVLPLENLMGDPQQEYFVDGMTEELTTELSKIGALKVISRTSAMQYKGAKKPLPQIARELGVQGVVEGSVMREGNTVRITVQLIDAPRDKHLWAENYQREMHGVLTLTAEVARAIAGEIKVRVTPEEQVRLARARPVNPEAYEAYLKGKFYLNKMTPEGFEKGLGYMQQAIDKDPANPLPYAGLALGYATIGHEALPDAFTRAKAAALKAAELGGTLAETEEALAEYKLYSEWDYEGAAKGFKRVMELNPNLPDAHVQYSWYLTLIRGYPCEEAYAEMKRAEELDPLAPLWPAWLAWEYWDSGRYDEAIAEARKSLELDPNFPWGLYVLGGVYAQKGMYAEAIATHQKAAAASPSLQWGLGVTYALAGRRDEARRIAAELSKKPTPMDTWGLTQIYAALGEKDQAFRWLEEAYNRRFSFMPWINCPGVSERTFFGPLRDDPRFQDMVRRMKVPE